LRSIATVCGVILAVSAGEPVFMARDRRHLLGGLKERKRSCTLAEVEAVLRAWGFTEGRSKGHARVWTFMDVVLVLHRPHGKHMDPGAVAMVIRCIERAEILQEGGTEDAD
jgi:hypothetical protein